ncbi:hypothetical protein [Fundidesulfovibrio agrisoli]|uniref:hypothetical protein n=1 Tax=Fundidesulfovibrio agrisoli TaxID=2922717 RepID=UPI001FABDE33|nr:hypothetical protein [Fundidesulfovibrio agrisoli]
MAICRTILLTAMVAVVALFACGAAQAQAMAQDKTTFPVITGENWVNATDGERLAFIAGLTTMVELEKEVQGDSLPPVQKSLVPSWVRGLSRYTLKEIVAAMDKAFATKPELKSKPVVEVLWYEVAIPETPAK